MKLTETAEKWLAAKKWTKFLRAVPVGKPFGFHFEDANEMPRIRVTAAYLMKNEPERRYAVSIDYNSKVVIINVTEQEK